MRAVFQWDCQLKHYNDLFGARINNDVGTQGRGSSFNGKLQRFTSKVKAEVPVRCLQQDMLCRERGRRQDWCEARVPEWPAGRNLMNVLPCIVCLTASCVASAFQKASRRCRMIARTLLWRQVYLPCWSALEHAFSRCRSVHGLPQRTHEGSTSRQPQRRRFVGVGAVLVAVGGSGIKKRGVATTHRCILRCLTQLGFEALSVATTQSIALKPGQSFSLRGLPCE